MESLLLQNITRRNKSCILDNHRFVLYPDWTISLNTTYLRVLGMCGKLACRAGVFLVYERLLIRTLAYTNARLKAAILDGQQIENWDQWRRGGEGAEKTKYFPSPSSVLNPSSSPLKSVFGSAQTSVSFIIQFHHPKWRHSVNSILSLAH